MKIEIVSNGGYLITSYDIESNPFKVGEVIHITISNYDKEFWEVKELKGSYLVDKIEHYIREEYAFNHKHNIYSVVSVEVTKID